MSAPGREIELKFLLDRADIAALLAALPAGEAALKAMQAVYYDTAGDTLHRAGFGLRVRRTGLSRIQTLKSAAGADGGRDEWEWPVPSDEPDLRLLADTPARLPAGARLEPRFTVTVSRAVRVVAVGDARIEIALDDGEVVAGALQETILELELELLSGPRDALDQLASDLRSRVALVPSTITKAERGFRLLSMT
jgi:triphosphatase